jgi:hypothetical protein
MSLSFTAVGRDVQAVADSTGDSSVGQAVKAFVQWYSDDNFLDSSWAVAVQKTNVSASITFTLIAEAAYEAPTFPSVVQEPLPEQVESQVRAQDGYVDPEADAQEEAKVATPVETVTVSEPATTPAVAPELPAQPVAERASAEKPSK